MFLIMALKIGSEGDKILKFCHPRRRFWTKIENMFAPDHVLYLKVFYIENISISKKQFDPEGK